jgi:hypothetical protein
MTFDSRPALSAGHPCKPAHTNAQSTKASRTPTLGEEPAAQVIPRVGHTDCAVGRLQSIPQHRRASRQVVAVDAGSCGVAGTPRDTRVDRPHAGRTAKQCYRVRKRLSKAEYDRLSSWADRDSGSTSPPCSFLPAQWDHKTPARQLPQLTKRFANVSSASRTIRPSKNAG